MHEVVHVVRPAIFAPAIVSVIIPFAAAYQSWWYLVGLPFVWVGSVCAQPNMNLANGCLAYVAMMLGFILLFFFPPLGKAILCGAGAGFYLSAIEKRMRMRKLL